MATSDLFGKDLGQKNGDRYHVSEHLIVLPRNISEVAYKVLCVFQQDSEVKAGPAPVIGVHPLNDHKAAHKTHAII